MILSDESNRIGSHEESVVEKETENLKKLQVNLFLINKAYFTAFYNIYFN